MIGIKGVGMTMLAEFLVAQGHRVSGSDTADTFMTDEGLKKAGISFHEHFSADNIPADADVIVYSTAYNESTNIEVKTALSGGTKVMTYAEALGELFNTHHGIAVCGSHGKTTISAWLGYVLQAAGLKPNVMVGATVPQFAAATLTGSSNYLVIEADEYQNKLQYFNPKMIVLPNIEYDHPDFFPTPADYEKVFADFVERLPKSGVLIANADDEAVRAIAETECSGVVVTYGLNSPADYIASDITYQNGKQYFKVSLGSEDASQLGEDETHELGDFSISLSGVHNVSNALAVIAASLELGIELRELRQHLAEFTGTARRMEKLGEYKGAVIIDDYGHHPTEIKATLEAMREKYPDKNLRVVFHPHTFTRTKAFLKEFGESFNKADEVIVLGIYGSAREEQGGVSAEDVAQEIRKNGLPNVRAMATQAEVETYLRETISHNDVIVLLGAGDVFRIGEKLLHS